MPINLIAKPVDYRLHTTQPDSTASLSYDTEPLTDTLGEAVLDTLSEAINDTGILIYTIDLNAYPVDYRLTTRVPKTTPTGNPGRTNLISWWDLDEPSGARADSHGSNNLTDTNTVTSVTGKVNVAADFDGGNEESLEIADNDSLSMADIGMTIGCWMSDIQVGSAATLDLLTKWGAAGNYEYAIQMVKSATGQKPQLIVSGDGTNTTTIAASVEITDGNWHFIVAWHDPTANTINIQLDNATATSASHTTGIFDGNSKFCMAARSSGVTNVWTGSIDEAFIYRRVLTSAERTWLYNSGNGRSYSELE